jgi:hypothetical protein
MAHNVFSGRGRPRNKEAEDIEKFKKFVHKGCYSFHSKEILGNVFFVFRVRQTLLIDGNRWRKYDNLVMRSRSPCIIDGRVDASAPKRNEKR